MHRWSRGLMACIVGSVLVSPSGRTIAQAVKVASVTPDHEFGDMLSREPSISADGRYVCFESHASNLVPGDTNREWDVFVKDMWTGTIRRVSVNSAGEQANGFSFYSNISANGRFVAWVSNASNLVANDTNDDWDYFVRDLVTGETRCVSVNSDGQIGSTGVFCDCTIYKIPGISANGRYVAFTTGAPDLVDDDTNGMFDVFRHDLWTGETIRVSLAHDGSEADYHCWLRDLSADGRYAVFHSSATNLVPNDTNDVRDIFIRDIDLGITERMSVSSTGEQADERSDSPRVSAHGRYVTFASYATNLVEGDTNGRWDVFVRDRRSKTTALVSISTDGMQGDGLSRHPSISDDGRCITFHALATTLVPGDLNLKRDIFMHDRLLGETIRISKRSDFIETNDDSYDAYISAGGRWAAYDTLASNLDAADRNGVRDVYRVDLRGRPLELTAPVPGKAGRVNSWEIRGVNAGARVQLVYGYELGSTPIPGCEIRVDIESARLVRTVVVDTDGEALVGAYVPRAARDHMVYFQAVERITARKSPVIPVSF